MAHLTILSMARATTDLYFLVNFRPVIETSTTVLMGCNSEYKKVAYKKVFLACPQQIFFNVLNVFPVLKLMF